MRESGRIRSSRVRGGDNVEQDTEHEKVVQKEKEPDKEKQKEPVEMKQEK